MEELGIYRLSHKEGGEVGFNSELVGICRFENDVDKEWFTVVARYCAFHDFYHHRLFGDGHYLIAEVNSENLRGFDCGVTYYYGRNPIVRGLGMLKCSANMPEGFLWFLHFCDFVQDYEAANPRIDVHDAVVICYEDWKARKLVSSVGCFS